MSTLFWKALFACVREFYVAGRSTLALYAVALVIGFHLRVLLAEEPWAARDFAEDWEKYKSRVRRWL